MSVGAAYAKSTQAEMVFHTVTAEGGTTSITKEHGPGIAVTRTGTGDYLLTWADDPGTFRGAVPGLFAATPANIAGHTIACGEYNATAFTLAVHVTENADAGTGAAPAAADLAADEHFTVIVAFSTTEADGA